MLDVFSVDKIFLFIAFVIPGFVTYKVYELICASGETPDFGTKIIDAIAYSCMNYAALSLLIYAVESSKLRDVHPELYILFYVFTLLIFPIILAFIWKKMRLSQWAQSNAPHPTKKAWDFFFSQRKTCFLVITLSDGTKVGGFFGLNSFATSYPEPYELFIEEEWILSEDGAFDRAVNGSLGILVSGSDIRLVNVYPDNSN